MIPEDLFLAECLPAGLRLECDPQLCHLGSSVPQHKWSPKHTVKCVDPPENNTSLETTTVTRGRERRKKEVMGQRERKGWCQRLASCYWAGSIRLWGAIWVWRWSTLNCQNNPECPGSGQLSNMGKILESKRGTLGHTGTIDEDLSRLPESAWHCVYMCGAMLGGRGNLFSLACSSTPDSLKLSLNNVHLENIKKSPPWAREIILW